MAAQFDRSVSPIIGQNAEEYDGKGFDPEMRSCEGCGNTVVVRKAPFQDACNTARERGLQPKCLCIKCALPWLRAGMDRGVLIELNSLSALECLLDALGDEEDRRLRSN